MQHIKLFEEFIQTKYYKQIKEFPERGKIAVDVDECNALQLALYQNKYRWPNRDITEPIPFEYHHEDPSKKFELGWFTVGNPKLMHPDKYKRLSGNREDIKNLDLLQFDDYFEPVEAYKGHHASKNYGV
jgi:hypothetical protein